MKSNVLLKRGMAAMLSSAIMLSCAPANVFATDTTNPSENAVTSATEQDFSSQELIVRVSDESKISDQDNVVSQYEDVYLLSYDSEEAASSAYQYYYDLTSDEGEFVAPNSNFEIADDSNEPYVSLDNEATSPLDELSNELGNSIPPADDENASTDGAVNSNETANEQPQDLSHAIALIDTGAKESSNIIDSVSMLGDDVTDTNGHASKMLDTMTAVDPSVQVVSIKAMDANGHGNAASIYSAIEYAIEKNIGIINLSLYGHNTENNAAVASIIQEATDAGITVVGAAGNDGADVKDYLPGSIDSVLVVGACDENGKKLETSNFGETVDYNVTAESTSVSAAKTSAYVATIGVDGIQDHVNDASYGIYVTDYTAPPAEDKSDESKEDNVTDDKSDEKTDVSDSDTEEKPKEDTDSSSSDSEKKDEDKDKSDSADGNEDAEDKDQSEDSSKSEDDFQTAGTSTIDDKGVTPNATGITGYDLKLVPSNITYNEAKVNSRNNVSYGYINQEMNNKTNGGYGFYYSLARNREFIRAHYSTSPDTNWVKLDDTSFSLTFNKGAIDGGGNYHPVKITFSNIEISCTQSDLLPEKNKNIQTSGDLITFFVSYGTDKNQPLQIDSKATAKYDITIEVLNVPSNLTIGMLFYDIDEGIRAEHGYNNYNEDTGELVNSNSWTPCYHPTEPLCQHQNWYSFEHDSSAVHRSVSPTPAEYSNYVTDVKGLESITLRNSEVAAYRAGQEINAGCPNDDTGGVRTTSFWAKSLSVAQQGNKIGNATSLNASVAFKTEKSSFTFTWTGSYCSTALCDMKDNYGTYTITTKIEYEKNDGSWTSGLVCNTQTLPYGMKYQYNYNQDSVAKSNNYDTEVNLKLFDNTIAYFNDSCLASGENITLEHTVTGDATYWLDVPRKRFNIKADVYIQNSTETQTYEFLNTLSSDTVIAGADYKKTFKPSYDSKYFRTPNFYNDSGWIMNADSYTYTESCVNGDRKFVIYLPRKEFTMTVRARYEKADLTSNQVDYTGQKGSYGAYETLDTKTVYAGGSYSYDYTQKSGDEWDTSSCTSAGKSGTSFSFIQTDITEGKTYDIDVSRSRYNIKYDPNNSQDKIAQVGETINTDYTTKSNMPQSKYVFGVYGKLRTNDFVRAGYRFTGWNTKHDGSGKSYSDGQINLMNVGSKNSTTTLYAQWEKQLGTTTLTVISEETGKPLKGVKFQLYKNYTTLFTGKQRDKVGDVITTNSAGKITLSDLHWYSYDWECVEAPAGYELAITKQDGESIDTSFVINSNNLTADRETIDLMKRVHITVNSQISNLIKGESAPSFMYHISGTDAAGVKHEYNVMVPVDEKTLTGTNTTFDMLAGTYTITQLDNCRYNFDKIQAVSNATIGKDNIPTVDVLNNTASEVSYHYSLKNYGWFSSMDDATNSLRT